MTPFPPATCSPVLQREALLARATAGDAEAQFQTAGLCRIGDEFTAQDIGEALRWYRLAAEQRHPGAQNISARCTCNGIGVAADFREASRWYRAAAEQGLAEAQFNLGMRYLHRQGVERAEREAARWFRSAAEQGYA
jgi:TPR repeat protein